MDDLTFRRCGRTSVDPTPGAGARAGGRRPSRRSRLGCAQPGRRGPDWRADGGIGTMLAMSESGSGALLPWQIVRVSGPSMAPALVTGDRLIVRRGARVRPGDVVLGRFADLPGLWVVKRAVEP